MKSITVLTIIVVFSLTVSLHAQPDLLWARTYGGERHEEARSLIQTADGGFALAGYTNSFGSGRNDFWLVRTDENGDSLWSRTFGGNESEQCNSIILTEDEGFALAGYTRSFGGHGQNFWLVRTDENGDSLWSRTFGGRGGQDICNSLIQTTDGGFALAGYTGEFGSGSYDFWLVKTNENGDSLWSNTFGGRAADECFSVIQTEDGGFALAGYTRSFGAGENDFWLVLTDENGDSLWSRTFGGAEMEESYSLVQTTDGGFALAGYTGDSFQGLTDFWLIKTDENGDSLWSRTFGGEGPDVATSLIQTTDGGFVLAGCYTATYEAGIADFWLIKTDENGDSLWSRTFGGEGFEVATSLIQTTDRGFVLAGYTNSFGAGDADFWLVRTDENGDSLWSRTFGGRSADYCYSLIQTVDGGFALAGRTGSFGAGEGDFWLVKTGPDPVSVPESDFILHPSSFILSSYPNPFNSSATIRFALHTPGMVAVALVDPLGRRVREMTPNSWFEAGWHSLSLDAAHLPAGKYFVVLHAGEDVLETPVTVVK